MLAYDAVDTPIGTLWVGVTEQGVCRLSFTPSEEDFVRELKHAFGVMPERNPTVTAEARHQIEEYFAGERDTFTLPLDLRTVTPFQRRVLQACGDIPYGETRTYADLATQAGGPNRARAVGNVMASNPIAIIIPCHRVIRSDGKLGEYGAGRHVKAYLLEMESRFRRPTKLSGSQPTTSQP